MVTGCVGPEIELVERFLTASQRGDNETVALLSMVSFPAEVESWNVLELTRARREPYRVPELRGKVAAAEHERDAQLEAFGEFRQHNYETLRRINERLRHDPEYHFPGQIGELQDQWEMFRLERKQAAAKLRDAEAAFELELRRVHKSLEREEVPEELSGELIRKDARVRVTTPDGDSHYVLALSRYELSNQFKALVPARWIITAVAVAD
jgi:hypothetical protein